MGINVDNLIVQQAKQDVHQAAATLSRDIEIYRDQQDIASLLAKDSKLANSIDNLIKNLGEVTGSMEPALPVDDPLKHIDVNASKLLEVTRRWATFRDALDQRNGSQPYYERLLIALNLVKPRQSNRDSLIKAVAIGDHVVQEFYEIAQEKNLNLRAPDLKLITVLRDDRTHSEAFEEPTPFIVGPLWGYNQAWNYIAYAHEVGHHIYRNVDGLDCELLVNVMLTLGAQGCTRRELYVWGAWLEEMFADLFCLLRVGPAAIHAGQRVALWIAATSRRDQPSSDTLTQILFTSRDWSHPPGDARVRMGLDALKLSMNMGSSDFEVQKQVQELEERWTNLAEPPTTVYINDKQENLADVLAIGKLVVTTLLQTPLYALANKEDSSSLPRSIVNVFYDENRFRKIPKVLAGQEEMWQILANTEFERDTVPDEATLQKAALQNIHDKAVKLLRQ